MNQKLHTSLEQKKELFESLFTWESPERIWEEKDRLWYISYSLFFLTLIGLAAILEEYILIVAIVAFVFLWFVQAVIPPEIATHTITSLGIRTYDKLFKWSSIRYYWFSEKSDHFFLNLDIVDEEFTSGERMHRLSLIIEEEDMSEIFFHLVRYIDYGDQEEINFNILVQVLHGTHIDITTFLHDDTVSQEDYLTSQGVELPETLSRDSDQDLENE